MKPINFWREGMSESAYKVLQNEFGRNAAMKVPEVFYGVFNKEGIEVARFDSFKGAKEFVKQCRYLVLPLFPASEPLLRSGTAASGSRDESQSNEENLDTSERA